MKCYSTHPGRFFGGLHVALTAQEHQNYFYLNWTIRRLRGLANGCKMRKLMGEFTYRHQSARETRSDAKADLYCIQPRTTVT
jgi:hypothetical protein